MRLQANAWPQSGQAGGLFVPEGGRPRYVVSTVNRKYAESLGRWMWLAVVAAPLRLVAAPLADSDYRYTLSGSIGLRTEDYKYETDTTTYTRQRLRKEVDLSGTGYVWDPRFLRLNVGLNLREEELKTSQGNSEYSMVGYNVGGTLFGQKRNPLSLHAAKSRTTVAYYAGPSYDMQTRIAGGRWGFDTGLLGKVRVSADRIDNVSDGGVVQRNETSEIAHLEGKKHIDGSEYSGTDVTYGYRYNNTSDPMKGTAQRQHQFYASDHTALGKNSRMNANFTYYDRDDIWQDAYSSSGVSVMNTQFMSGNASVYFAESEKLRHSYSVSASNSEVNTSVASSYSARGGIEYVYNERWQQHATLEVRQSSVVRDVSASVWQKSVETGVRYANRVDEWMLRSGYTVAIENRDGDGLSSGGATTVRNVANFGFARSNNPLWRDNGEYRISGQTGWRNSVEHIVRYVVGSTPTGNDNINGTAEIRNYVENDAVGERSVNSRRLTVAWTRRIYSATSLSLSGSLSRNEGTSLVNGYSYDEFGNVLDVITTSGYSSADRRYFQARLTSGWYGLGSTQVSMALRRESNASSVGDDSELTVVEGDATYTRGKWQFRARYRLRNADYMESSTREQSIMLFGSRRFGGLF